MDSDEDIKPSPKKPTRGRGRGRGRGGRATRGRKSSTSSAKSPIIKDETCLEEEDLNESIEDKPDQPLSPTSDFDISKTSSSNTSGHYDMSMSVDELPPIPIVGVKRVPLHNNEPLSWHHEVNLIGEKVTSPRIDMCDVCALPILLYGRMFPCKHVFCYDCASQSEPACPNCNDRVLRVEKASLGSVYKCKIEKCGRTYLSQRDLEAHHNHRHQRKSEKSKHTHHSHHDPRPSIYAGLHHSASSSTPPVPASHKSPGGHSSSAGLRKPHRGLLRSANVPNRNIHEDIKHIVPTSGVILSSGYSSSSFNPVQTGSAFLPPVVGGSSIGFPSAWNMVPQHAVQTPQPTTPSVQKPAFQHPFYAD